MPKEKKTTNKKELNSQFVSPSLSIYIQYSLGKAKTAKFNFPPIQTQ